MHGPYAARIRTADGATVELDGETLARDRALVNSASRFYSRVGGTTLHDAETLGVFAAADLLLPGEEVEIDVLGFEGRGEDYCRKEPDGRVVARSNRARREPSGVFVTTLGSKWNERRFLGV